MRNYHLIKLKIDNAETLDRCLKFNVELSCFSDKRKLRNAMVFIPKSVIDRDCVPQWVLDKDIRKIKRKYRISMPVEVHGLTKKPLVF